jgi:predicted Na+-dependent transporter
MNLKRLFGSVLTVLGTTGLIYTAVVFVNAGEQQSIKALVVYGLLSLIFFVSGISLIRTT